MVEFETHLGKEYLAIPHRIHKKIYRYLKQNRIKRKDRKMLEQKILEYVKCLADDFCKSLDKLVSKLNIDHFNDEFYKLLFVSQNLDDATLSQKLTVGLGSYYDMEDRLKNLILHSTMLYIIETKGKNIGPMYSLLFARSYGIDLDYAMQYGYDETDKGDALLEEYKALGGCINILCVPNYFKACGNNYSVEEMKNLIRSNNLLKEFKRENKKHE